MSKRRTKNQKQTAHHHYQLGNWYTDIAPSTSTRQNTPTILATKQIQLSATTLYGYAPAMIRRDLWKTVWVTLGILVLEVGLYRFWH